MFGDCLRFIMNTPTITPATATVTIIATIMVKVLLELPALVAVPARAIVSVNGWAS